MKETSFENYIKGKRHGKLAHDLERLSQDDPFLADAIEGFDSVDGDHLASIAKMQDLVQAKVRASKRNTFTASMYWRAMAVCVVLALLIGGGYMLMLDEKNNNEKYSTASSDTESIELYIPKKYIEKKDNQIMQGRGLSSRPVENIENLEVLNVERDLCIYLPKDYSTKENKDQDEALIETIVVQDTPQKPMTE